MPNRLAAESSPYLLQHQHNPVAWQPWDEQALAQARQEQKPIFLSIGYSACHWCHVMEHESFENPRLAAQLNADFVCIKVDREERPDLDQIYMHAVQLLTGRGGWPMSVFLTPDLRPFYGGTYWPPQGRGGMPGFDQVLSAVVEAWRNRRSQIDQQAEHLTEHLQALALESAGGEELSSGPLRAAEAYLCRVFDESHGGFGGAPKFPHPMDLRLLLRGWRTQRNDRLLHVVTHTLDKMAAGGIYDHLGGGFHRYSVDARWLVPHFEKMLYDNALLATVYVEAFQATGRAEYTQVVRETLDFVLREMTDPQGGFYSTQDADSEGEEGKFYVWTPAELERILGVPAAQRFAYVYDVSPEGNFEGQSILNRPKTLAQCAQLWGMAETDLAAELTASRARLLAERSQRVPPGLDDKVLASWNGLMIEALSLAGSALAEPRFVQAAQKAAGFLISQMSDARGRLLHSWRQGKACGNAFLDDYAAVAHGLVALHQADGDERWLSEAARLLELVLAQFEDVENGGFFFTANEHEQLIARTKDVQDSSVPSGNGLAVTALLKLGRLTGDGQFIAAAERALRAFATLLERSPAALGQLLLGLDFHLTPTNELVLAGPTVESLQSFRAAVGRRFLPHAVWASRAAPPAGPLPLDALFVGKRENDGSPTLYVCRDHACEAPLVGVAAIEAALDRLAGARTD